MFLGIEEYICIIEVGKKVTKTKNVDCGNLGRTGQKMIAGL